MLLQRFLRNFRLLSNIMKQIWAPWRMKFINAKKTKGCVFCRKLKEKKDSENLVLYRGKKMSVIMNLYPYNNGHLMVVPNRHTAEFSSLTDEELLELMKLTGFAMESLKKSCKPGGFNVGINLGKAAGAGVKSHLHVQIVPRWVGDGNFMPVVGRTKVIAESLCETYKKLKKVIRQRRT